MSDMVGCEWKGSRVLESAAYFACFPIATIRRDVGKFFKLFLGVLPYFHLYVGEYSVVFNSGCIFMFLFFPDNWWSQVCPRYFLRLVDLYKGAVVYLLSGRKTLLIPVLFSSYITAALRLLEKLHKVSLGCTLAQDANMQILTRSCLPFAN